MLYSSKNNKLEEKIRHLEEENGFIRDANRKIRLLLDATEESAILCNQDGQVLASNKRAAQRLGKTVDGLVGLNMYDYLPKELADSRKQYGDEALGCGRTVRFQDQRAGHVYDNHITPIFNEEGHFEAFAVYARDITHILQLEKNLQESETKFKSITEQSPNMIFINVDGKIVYANSRCKDLMGYTQEEFYASDFDFRGLIASDSMKQAERQHIKHLAGHDVVPYECGVIKKNGERLDVVLSTKLLQIGENVGILGIMTDITERKKMEEALRNSQIFLEDRVRERTDELAKTNTLLEAEISERKKAQKALETSHRKLRSLAAQLSMAEERERRRVAAEVHDHIGQNLAFTKIQLEELRRAAEPDQRAKWEGIFRLLDDTIRDTRALVSELGSPVLYELGLVPALQWLTGRVQEQTGISVHLEDKGRSKSLDENAGIFVYQAVRELLTNVAKHASASHCTVSLAVKGDQVEVQVTDDGKGFDVGRIYDITNTNTGFGLFSIQERSEQLGGQLLVSSKPGEGTQITLSLPIDQ